VKHLKALAAECEAHGYMLGVFYLPSCGKWLIQSSVGANAEADTLEEAIWIAKGRLRKGRGR